MLVYFCRTDQIFSVPHWLFDFCLGAVLFSDYCRNWSTDNFHDIYFES